MSKNLGGIDSPVNESQGGTNATTFNAARANLGLNATINSQTVGYTALTSDRGRLIHYTGAGGVTLALDPAATLLDGWSCIVRNDAALSITINPDAGELINGAATLTLEAGQAITVICDGIGFFTQGQAAAPAGTGANTALSNLAAVAINASLISDTDVTDDLGSLAIRWNNIYAQALNTGNTAADTLKIRGYDVDGTTYVDFLTVTAGNTPTAVLNGDVTSTTQAPNDNSTKLATTAYADAAAAAGGATVALDNLVGVAVNTSLISDTDATDDLGSLGIRWKDVFAQTLNTGDTNADTLKIRGYDVDGAIFVDFLTVTAGNTPTAVLSGNVTSTTQSFGDSSTKLATTAFTQTAKKQVVNAQTLAYTAVSADLGKVILYTGAGGVDLSLDPAATLTDGWFTTLRNDSAGTITINPNGAETINGAATLAVAAGDGVIIYTNGTLFYTVGEASASSGANTALSNLAAVAINTSLTSDTDITDDLGTQAIRWNNIYAATLQTGDTAADTLQIGAWDVDGSVFTPFITCTANNTPTCVIASGVTGTTQAANDSSTKLATTQYVDDAVAAAPGGSVNLGLTYLVSNSIFSN